MSDGRPAVANQQLGPNTGEVRDPILEFKNGVIAGDAITLRMAANKVGEVFDVDLKVPPVVRDSQGALFEELAVVTVEDLVVTALIDTGKMTWEDGDGVQKDRFYGYDQQSHQSARFQSGGVVAEIGEVTVSRQRMVTPQGKPVYVWFAELPLTGPSEPLTRYGIIESAQKVSESFDKAAEEGRGQKFDEVSVPAAQAEYTSKLVEILEVNPELEDARQEVKLALDYTGARALAKTTIRMRGLSTAPLKTHYVFGEKGPVVFWFTGTDSDRTPFAVTVTEAEAWLGPDQSADFEF